MEFGRTLSARCLECHAGKPALPFESASTCSACHEGAGRDWGASAHANSLSHLHMVTVDPADRSPKPLEFAPVRGMACAECHRPGGKRGEGRGERGEWRREMGDDQSAPTAATAFATATSPSTATAPTTCPFAFDRSAPPGESCRRCHAAAHEQWTAWKSGPQPRRLDWPPGQIDRTARGDTRSCADCHMPSRPVEGGQAYRDHRWAARRYVAMLAGGIDVRVVPARATEGNQAVQLVLTNLAGHEYPTGASLRAVRLLAGPEGAGELRPAATFRPALCTGRRGAPVPPAAAAPGPLTTSAPDSQRSATPTSDAAPGSTSAAAPRIREDRALLPGEQRTVWVEVPAGTRAVAYELRYYRNLTDANAYTAVILSGQAPVLYTR